MVGVETLQLGILWAIPAAIGALGSAVGAGAAKGIAAGAVKGLAAGVAGGAAKGLASGATKGILGGAMDAMAGAAPPAAGPGVAAMGQAAAPPMPTPPATPPPAYQWPQGAHSSGIPNSGRGARDMSVPPPPLQTQSAWGNVPRAQPPMAPVEPYREMPDPGVWDYMKAIGGGMARNYLGQSGGGKALLSYMDAPDERMKAAAEAAAKHYGEGRGKSEPVEPVDPMDLDYSPPTPSQPQYRPQYQPRRDYARALTAPRRRYV